MAEVARWRELAGALDAAADDDRTGSLSAAVRHGGRTVWTHAAGWADREQGWRADAATVYRVGSISKTVAVTVALRLAERGLLDVDEPVARLVPEIETTVGYAGSRASSRCATWPPTPAAWRESRASPGCWRGRRTGGRRPCWGAIRPPASPIRRASASITRTSAPPSWACGAARGRDAVSGAGRRRDLRTARPHRDRVPAAGGPGAAGHRLRAAGRRVDQHPRRRAPARRPRLPRAGRRLYSTPSEIAAFAAALGPGAEDVLLSATSRREMLRLATRKSEECSPGPSNGYGTGVELYLDGTRVLAYGTTAT